LFKIRNKSNQIKFYKINVTGLDNAKIIGHARVKVSPGELSITSIAVTIDMSLVQARHDIRFNIVDIASNERVSKNTSFYSGSGV